MSEAWAMWFYKGVFELFLAVLCPSVLPVIRVPRFVLLFFVVSNLLFCVEPDNRALVPLGPRRFLSSR